MTPQLIPTAAAARLLGISERQTRRLAQSSEHGHKVGRNWFLTQAGVEALRDRPSPGPVPKR